MPKKYRVTLTAEERRELERLLSRGKADVRCLKHAQILLKADEADGGPGWSDERIAEAFTAGVATIERLRQRFVEEGLQAALRTYRTGTRIYERKLDGARLLLRSHIQASKAVVRQITLHRMHSARTPVADASARHPCSSGHAPCTACRWRWA